MLFCVLTKTGKVRRLDFHPLRSMSWLRGGIPAQAGYLAQERSPSTQSGSSRQCWGLAEEADLKARFPRSQPSSLREPGAQDSAGPQAPQATQTGAGPCKLPLLDPTTGPSGGDKGEIQLLRGLGPANGQPRPGLWSSAGHSPQPVPRAPSSLAGPRPWGLEGPGAEAQTHLSLNLCQDHGEADNWLSG